MMRQWIGSRSTREAARALGLSHTTIQFYLRGQSTPSMQKAKRLSKRMGISYELILSMIANDRRERALAKWSPGHVSH